MGLTWSTDWHETGWDKVSVSEINWVRRKWNRKMEKNNGQRQDFFFSCAHKSNGKMFKECIVQATCFSKMPREITEAKVWIQKKDVQVLLHSILNMYWYVVYCRRCEMLVFAAGWNRWFFFPEEMSFFFFVSIEMCRLPNWRTLHFSFPVVW